MAIAYPLSPPAIAGLGPQDFTLSEVNVVGESESPFTLERQVQQWPGQRWELEANLPPMKMQKAEQWLAFLGALRGKSGYFLMGDYNRPTPQGPMSNASLALAVNGPNPSGSNNLLLRNCAASIANWAVAGDYISPVPASLNLPIQSVTITGSHGLILARGVVQFAPGTSLAGVSLGASFTITGNALANGTWSITGVDTVGLNVSFLVGISSGGTQAGGNFIIGNFAPQRLYKLLTNASSDTTGQVQLDIFPSIRETINDGTTLITKNCVGTFALKDNTTKWEIDRDGVYKISFKAKEYI
jgi:hypothetical protein